MEPYQYPSRVDDHAPILFYDSRNPYYEFTNVCRTPFRMIVGGRTYDVSSSEGPYQAFKGMQPDGSLSSEAVKVRILPRGVRITEVSFYSKLLM